MQGWSAKAEELNGKALSRIVSGSLPSRKLSSYSTARASRRQDALEPCVRSLAITDTPRFTTSV
jgi:hypothetical protein